MFSIAIFFLDIAMRKNSIAFRSTNVTFTRSSASLPPLQPFPDRAFSTSGTYSPVKCPCKLTLLIPAFSACFVIFNMCLSTLAHTTAGLTSTSCAKLRLRLFELMLVNAERTDLRIKRRCSQAEPSGSAERSINPATRFPQHSFDLSFSIRSDASRNWRCHH